MDKVVLLNSGGIDSRVSAAMLEVSGMEIHSLFIDWNPTCSITACLAAEETADLYCKSHTVFPWPVDWMTYYPNLKKSTTPFAALGTFSLGVQYAHHIGANYVASGIRREISVDDNWLESLRTVINANAFAEPKVLLLPVYDMTNNQVTETAIQLGVNLVTTYSCTVVPPCGECRSCDRRKEQGL